jgi:hypothetical protein
VLGANLPLERLKITLIPANIDLTKLKEERKNILFTIPYCVKSLDCPAGRSTDNCFSECTKCAVSKLVGKLKSLRIDYRIVTDDRLLFKFLEDKKGEYRYLVGLGCNFIISMYGRSYRSELGIFGVASEIYGETCKTKEDFKRGLGGKKRGQTYINEEAVDAILSLLK